MTTLSELLMSQLTSAQPQQPKPERQAQWPWPAAHQQMPLGALILPTPDMPMWQQNRMLEDYVTNLRNRTATAQERQQRMHGEARR